MCVCVCRMCTCLCLCLCTLRTPSVGQFACGLLFSPMVWCPVGCEARAGRMVWCWINANKVSGVGCDNAVDGDGAGGKDKVAVVKS